MLCNPRVQAQPEAMSFVPKEALEAMLGCSLFVNENHVAIFASRQLMLMFAHCSIARS